MRTNFFDEIISLKRQKNELDRKLRDAKEDLIRKIIESGDFHLLEVKRSILEDLTRGIIHRDLD